MKRTFIFTLFSISMLAISLASCKSSRVWETKDRSERTSRNNNIPPSMPPTRYYSSAALIVSPTPGFTMNRFHDGRYFHRSAGGLLYWKGYDNRFFLDAGYLNRANYSKWEYDEWKRFKKASENNRRR